MHRVVAGVFVLLLAWPALRADDKPKDQDKDKPATPAEQYQALQKDALEAQQAFQKKLRDAKPEERGKLFEQNPVKDLAPKFLELAEKHSKDPIALDALTWVMTNTSRPTDSKELRAKAIAMLLRDHVDNAKLGAVCQTMAFGIDKQNDAFLRTLGEKSQNAEVQAEACLALAQSVAQKAMIAKRMREDPEMAQRLESAFGKEQADELKKADLAKIDAESEQLFKQLVDKHIAALQDAARIEFVPVAAVLRRQGRRLPSAHAARKDSRIDVQGAACITLAQALKQRADDMPETQAKEAEKLRAESEKLFELAVEKYAEVKFMRGTIGKTAKRELFDLRNLSVGKPAPIVEGEDQDGQKFKLSDYNGKVVLLDFWSQF